MNKKFSRSVLASSIAAALLLDATPALAQLEEIIVTARKRDETILQIPVTTSVVSSEALEQFAISDVKGVTSKVPGLNFSQGPLTSGVLMSLRGIGTTSNNPMMDQSIALVADGMQFTQGLAMGAAMFDIAQVEVLKGPQALFFGKAAPAGVISVRSQDPGTEFEASVRAGYEFEGEEKLVEAIVSGPVTDTLGLRLAAQHREMEGYFHNKAEPVPLTGPFASFGDLGAAPVKHKDFPESQNVMFKGTAVWEPTDNFNARLKLNYSEADSQGAAAAPQIVSCEGGNRSGVLPSQYNFNTIAGDDCELNKDYALVSMDPAYFPGIYNNGEPFGMVRQDFGSLELNYDLGNRLSLTSVTGFYDVKSASMLPVNLSSNLGGPMVVQGTFARHDYSEELRLTSDYEGDLNFLLGAFYQIGHTNYKGNLPGNQAYKAPFGPFPKTFGSQHHNVEVETKSVFGQLLYKLTPDLELGVGTRWSDETRSDKVHDYAAYIISGGLAPVAEINLAKPEINSETWSPEVSLSWTPSYNLTVFGNLKEAYKSGSYDVSGGFKNGEDASFDDERVRGGEIGLKTRLADDTVAVNATTYYYKYNDLQVEANVFDPASGVAGVRTLNAATATVHGVDFDITWAPREIEGLSLFTALNWNKARFDKFDTANCYTGQTWGEGCNIDTLTVGGPGTDGVGDFQDLSDEALTRAPEWTGNFGFNYQMPVLDEMMLRFGSNTTFSSSFVASAGHESEAVQSGYQKTSLNVGLVGPQERWTLELIGDNVFDRLTYGNCVTNTYADTLVFGKAAAGTGTVNGGAASLQMACFVERGRSTWLRLTVKI